MDSVLKNHLSERGKLKRLEKMFWCQCVRNTIENGIWESYPKDWLTVIFLVSERKTELIFGMANIYVYIIKFSYPDYKYVLTG